MSKAESRIKEAWELLVALLVGVALVGIPLRLALGYGVRDSWLALAFEGVMTVVFAADIAMNLRTAVSSGPAPGARGPAPAGRYFRSWFVPDLLAALPFALLMPAAGAGGALRLLQLNRLLKVPRVAGRIRGWLRRRRISPGTSRFAFFLLGISFFAHWTACGWIILTGDRSYLDAIYWTVTTLTTVGYGDITPADGPQKLYTMLVMLAGAGSYGYLIGNFASLLASLDLVRSGQIKKLEQVDAFLRHQSVPEDLHHRVRDYYERLFSSRSVAGGGVLLDELPDPLRTEVALHMHRHILRKVPLFQGAGEAFVRAIVTRLRPVLYPPGTRVVEAGQPGDAMFFVASGTVEILDPDGSVRDTVSEGGCFGEMALVLDEPRNASVRCRDFCELYVLGREDFDRALGQFPEFAEQARRTASERAELRRGKGDAGGDGR